MKKRAIVLYDPPPPYGGVRVSAQKTLIDLRRFRGIDYFEHLFDSNTRPLPFALFIFFAKACRSDVLLFQIGDVLTLTRKRAILYWCFSILVCKSKVFRGFAGGLMLQFQALSRSRQFILKKILGSFEVVTFQTMADCRFFTALLSNSRCNVYWLPNTRGLLSYELPARTEARKFCFLGKVYRLKGVHHIINAAASLPPGVIIDIYGPMEACEAEDIGLNLLPPDSPVRYCGSVEPERSTEVLKQYDALILPTTWKTEGHPGVILEAFSVGLPVIATRWNGIPELVDDTCGILIEPHSTDALIEAIHNMYDNPQQWQSMRMGALERLKQFDPQIWTERLHHLIMEATN